MTLQLYFLGAPRIERDGRPIETDTRKAVALLAYLAVTRTYQLREALAALLWPEMDDERARGALRRTLSSLKGAIGDEALYITREGIALQGETDVWTDVTAFDAAVTEAGHLAQTSGGPCVACVELLEPAVALYRDHFLSGFSLRDSVAFDDWQLAVTEQLRRGLSSALHTLVEVHAQLGRYEQALEYGGRWLAVDPLREDAHRWMMQLYAWSGLRDVALRQYRDAVRILDEELGVEPLPETTALYEAIQEGRLSPAAAPPAAAVPPAPEPEPERAGDAAPLIGREAAWGVLAGAYRSVATSGQVVAIGGEAGIGKTRLAEAFLDEARSHGAQTVVAPCYEGEANLAYAPFAAALRALLRRPGAGDQVAGIPAHWLSEVARLLPELQEIATVAAPPLESSSPGAQARFFAAVTEVLCRLLAGPAPGVLFLDDAQWADAASLDLLAYMARRLDELPVLLLVASVDTGDGDRRLQRLMAEAQRAGVGRRVTLGRWQPADVAALVAAIAPGGGPAETLSDRLYRETEGLPYFVVEYLAALAQAPEDWAMPQSVRDLLAGRLAGVDQTAVQLLQAAAVIGRSFDYAILWEASGRSEEEVISGLERLLARGLIREASDGEGNDASPGDLRYDFAHQKLRSLVYDDTHLARRRLLHRRVAAALQARAPRADAAASQIGHHYRLGGQDALAADFYRRAGEYARSLYANREALSHFQLALALGHPDTAALNEALGDLHTLLGEYTAAIHAYESAAAVCDEAALGQLEHKLGRVHERRGQWELAASHYCAALDQVHDAAALAELQVDRSRVAYRSGDLTQAQALAEEALALARSSGDATAEAQAENGVGLLARQAGDLAAARDHLARSLALAAQAGTLGARVAALNNLARLYGETGRIDEALALLEEAVELCVRQGDRHHEAALYNHRADLLHRAGRREDAMASLKAAVGIYAEIGLESGDWQPEIWKLTEW